MLHNHQFVSATCAIVSHAKVFWDIYLLGDTIYTVYPMHLKIQKNTIFFKVNEC